MAALQIRYSTTDAIFIDFLSAADPDDRLSRATALFMKQASISEVSKRIAQSVDESLSKQQKEFFLRQQLAAIQRELSNLQRTSSPLSGNPTAPGEDARPPSGSELDDDQQNEVDEMADIKTKIEAMAKDSEERKMAVREWKRLKRIPQGSVEYGVIRNYVSLLMMHLLICSTFLTTNQLEWLVAIPWPGSSTTAPSTSLDTLRDRGFLKKTRQQLDADHYGLEKIKKRLIEYLAVVRLKALQADQEVKEQAATPASDSSHGTPSTSARVPQRRNTVKGPILLYVPNSPQYLMT